MERLERIIPIFGKLLYARILILKSKGRNYVGEMYENTEISRTYFFKNKRLGKAKVLRNRFVKSENFISEINSSDKFGNPYTLKIGDTVIHKTDNSDENFDIGKVFGFDDCNGKYAGSEGALPLLEFENGYQCITFGIVVPYNEALKNVLSSLNPMEQWNLLCRDHCQKGKEDETFELESKRAPLQWYKTNASFMY